MADYDFENITPWDGEKDTGYHVRMKWKRNFERIKAFISEIRGELAEIGHNLSTMFLRKDQDDRTEHSLGVGGDLIIDGAAHIGQAMLVYDEVNHAIRVTAADGSGLTIGLWADGFISAMGLNTSGASGSGEGASALYQLVDVVANATGDGVSGAAVGKVLMYNGTKWEAATVVIPTKLSQFIDDIGLLNEADRQTILDSLSSHTGNKSNPHAVSFSQLTSHPTTVEGYGITNALTDDDGMVLSEAIGDASERAGEAMTVALRAEFLAEHALDDLFELVNLGTDGQPSYAIRAKFGFYSDSFISAMGLNTSGASGSGEGASALYQLVDVVANATGDGVNGAAVGKVLMYNGTKWEAATVVIPTKLSQFIDDIGLLNEADRQTILDSLSSHTGNKSNPHAVTKAQVGLGSVDNLAASAYFTALSSTSDTNLSATIGGTVRTIASLYATYLGGQPSSYYATAAALSSHTGNKSNPHAVSFSQLTSHPTTVEGYGITNALTDDDGMVLSEAIGDASERAGEAMTVALRAEFLAEHALDDLFELVNLGTDGQPSYAIRAKFGFYSDSFISAMGLNNSGASGGSGGGASALYQLVDVAANATGDGVIGAAVGKVLMYNGTKWEAATVVIPTKLSQFIDDIGLLYEADGQAITDALANHTGDKSNPHAVTKAQIGLGSVDNLAASDYFTALSSTSATNLSATIGGTVRTIAALYATYLGGQPSSYYATAAALTSHTSNKDNPHAVTKAQVGLGSVDNLAASAYFTALSSTSDTNLSATIGGTVRSIAALYATYLGGQPSSYYATAAALTSHTGNKSNPHAVSFSQLTSHPTTVEGYGITNALTDDDGMALSEAIGDASERAGEAMTVALRAEFIAEHALDDLFELVNLGTDGQPSYAIRAKFGFYSDSFISAMGLNNSGAPSGSGGAASALYQLVDVVANATGDGVSGAAVGKVLMYNGTKWEAATVVIPTKLSQFIDDIGLLYDSDGQALAVAIHEAIRRAATAQCAADMAHFTAERAQDAASLAHDAADKAAADASSALSEHTGNKNNPHAVTKAQVGLGSVDNLAASAYFTALSSTSDTNLSATIGGTVRSIAALYATYLGGQPSSYYATAEALNSHTSNKSNPHAVTKAQVGLGSVDNLAASAYFTALSSTSSTNLSATIGGTVRTIAALYATYLGGQPSSYYATAAALSSHTGNKSNPHAVSFSQLTSHPTTVEGYGITNALTDDDGIALSEAIGDASQQAREAMSVASNLQQEVDRQLDNDDAQAVISYLMQQIRQLSDQVSRLTAEVNQLRSYWQLDANGDLYTKHNLYSQKAITAMKTV